VNSDQGLSRRIRVEFFRRFIGQISRDVQKGNRSFAEKLGMDVSKQEAVSEPANGSGILRIVPLGEE